MPPVIKPALCALLLLLATPTVADPGFAVSLGPGVKYGPAYFGSAELEFGPTGKLSFGDGSPRPGLSLHGAYRFIGARRSSDHAELLGLEDVPLAIELGGGLAYEGSDFRLSAELRQGFGGHSGQVAEFGGDYILPFGDRFTLSFGPRALYATRPYFDAYFNVTPLEAAASGFAAYSAGAGLVSTGAHIEARYRITPDWTLIGTFDHELLRGAAAASPIVLNGTARQNTLAITVTRRFSF